MWFRQFCSQAVVVITQVIPSFLCVTQFPFFLSSPASSLLTQGQDYSHEFLFRMAPRRALEWVPHSCSGYLRLEKYG